HDVDGVRYRQEVLRDLEREPTLTRVKAFAQRMKQMRQHLAQAEKLRHRSQKERWFLDAVSLYCDAVKTLARDLVALEVSSRGVQAFRDYLTAYTASQDFTALVAETQQVHHELASVQYSLAIRGNRVTVSVYAGEPDYSAEVTETFARFQQGAIKDYLVTFADWPEMNHVEERILELVARLYPAVFQALDQYYTRHRAYLDETIGAFDREAQFYVAYLDFIAPLKAAGLPFCYPTVSSHSKDIFVRETFDLALANMLIPAKSPVVRNDFFLTGAERILVVTGPNQGGKTTFARTVGQLHYLASLGLSVPGSQAQLFLPDCIFTHFEKEESLATLRGKLEDELIRLHTILEEATSNSVIIMNESFSSTTLHDALFLGTQALRRISALDALCVYVTFVDELASFGPATVSMVSLVAPDNPAERTYKIVRQPANGLAYAAAIAEKYGLTYQSLTRRLAARAIRKEGIL
ncbi:MAG TPA: hypothetical protein VKQ36_12635, partial [Ktedonobacterales bacterium]|nr:hypothetical protein [Ktedonobacterales bacterium]